MTTAMEKAQARLEADKAKASRAGDSPNAAAQELVRKLKSADYLDDLGNCMVSVKVPGRNEPVAKCMDPGPKWISYMASAGDSDPFNRAMFLVAIARGIDQIDIKANRDVELLGIKKGDSLPNPERFIDDHIDQWKAYKKEQVAITRANIRGANKAEKSDQEWIDEPWPDEPETKLDRLLTEELNQSYLERIAEGIEYAILQPQYSEEAGTGN